MNNSQQRSTKGASKQRRDNINCEVSIIRSLLPLPDAVRNRLSQLQVMSLCKAFVGKSNLLSTLTNDKSDLLAQLWDFTHALPGFLIVTDEAGCIVYLTDNSVEHLGHSMVDIVSQCESVIDLVHAEDRDRLLEGMRNHLPWVFSCRMGLMKHPRRNHAFDKYKRMKMSGRMVVSQENGQRYLVALCTPTLNPVLALENTTFIDTLVFKSRHSLDMKLISLDQNGLFHLGYHEKPVTGMSWYNIIHPEDVDCAARKHSELLRSTLSDFSVSLSVRFQRSDCEMVWVQVVMRKDCMDNSSEPSIVCSNQLMHPEEVTFKPKRALNVVDTKENYRGMQGVVYEGCGKAIKRECNSELDEQECKKRNRSELIEKLKKKMKKNDEDVDGNLLNNININNNINLINNNNNMMFWQNGIKNEINDSFSSSLATAHNGEPPSTQAYIPLQPSFASSSSSSSPASSHCFKQSSNVPFQQVFKNESTPFSVDLPSTQHVPCDVSPLKSDMMLLQESLVKNFLDNPFSNALNNPFNNSNPINNPPQQPLNNNSNISNLFNSINGSFDNTLNNSFNVNFNAGNNNTNINCSNTATINYTDVLANNSNNNLKNNNNVNNNNNPNNNNYYLDNKSTTWPSPSYTESSHYSANSPPNSEDLNNQSFFAQTDEIKSELTFLDNKAGVMLNDTHKPKLSGKSSFPELEAQDVAECLKLLEDPKEVKTECPEVLFSQLPPLNPLQSHSMEEVFNFPSNLCNDDFAYMNEFSCLSNAIPSSPAAGLQALPMAAF